MGDDHPLSINAFDDHEVVALGLVGAQVFVVGTRVVAKVTGGFGMQADKGIVADFVGDRALKLGQDGVTTVDGAVAAHEHGFGSIEGSDFVGVTGIELAHPGVADALDGGGEGLGLAVGSSGRRFRGSLARGSDCGENDEQWCDE